VFAKEERQALLKDVSEKRGKASFLPTLLLSPQAT
jgi:hypothetical protein